MNIPEDVERVLNEKAARDAARNLRVAAQLVRNALDVLNNDMVGNPSLNPLVMKRLKDDPAFYEDAAESLSNARW